MFLPIAWFEIRFWLRSWMLWIFLFIVSLLTFAVIGSDEVASGFNLSNTFRNAPFVIESFYAGMGLFTLLMTAIFVNSAALRDFNYNTWRMMYSLPLRRRDLLLGRFAGATLVSLVPMLGVSVGILLARFMPGADPERWEAVHWSAHFKGILLFALPDTVFTAGILFAVAVVWRRDIASFIAAILLVIGRSVSAQIFQDVRWENLRGLLDPFGVRTFTIVTKYWTVADKNSLSAGLSGLLLWNRLLWVGVACAAFALAYSRFSFTERRTKNNAPEQPARQPRMKTVTGPLPRVRVND